MKSAPSIDENWPEDEAVYLTAFQALFEEWNSEEDETAFADLPLDTSPSAAAPVRKEG